MTNKYEYALYEFTEFAKEQEDGSVYVCVSGENYDAIRTALKLARRAEQMRKERGRFVTAIWFDEQKYHHSRVVEALRKENAELKAKLAKTEWQPIETALKDWTEILITDGSYVEIGLFECRDFVVRNNGDYLDGGYGSNYRTGAKFDEYAAPTHWMPLPQPPPTTEETKCPT